MLLGAPPPPSFSFSRSLPLSLSLFLALSLSLCLSLSLSGANLGEKTEVGIDSEHVDREQKAQVMAWEVKRVNPQVHIPVVCYPCLCSSKTPCSICTETGACDLILFLFLLRRSAVPQRAKRRRMFLISR
jgi:hypothetical protein